MTFSIFPEVKSNNPLIQLIHQSVILRDDSVFKYQASFLEATLCAARVGSGSRYPCEVRRTYLTAVSRLILCPVETKRGLIPSRVRRTKPTNFSLVVKLCP